MQMYTYTTILIFTFSTVFNKLHDIELYCKLCFLLYDLSQLMTNVNFLSTLKVGYVEL